MKPPKFDRFSGLDKLGDEDVFGLMRGFKNAVVKSLLE